MRRQWLLLAALALACAFAVGAQTLPGLDTTTFIVMGEGLAAGMGNFGLSSNLQVYSFPAQAAAQMKTGFEQPLIEPPGIGNIVGYPGQEVRLPTYPQGSVRQFYSQTTSPVTGPPLLLTNLSVPGLTLQDSVSIRPSLPIVQRDMKQTVVNMILGFPQLLLDVPIWSQFEYAREMYPSMAMIELGYTEALNAAVNLDPTQLPNPATFGATYTSVVSGLRDLQAQVIVTTIPNPLDTAYFSTAATASSIVYLAPSAFAQLYPQVGSQDYLTRNALMTISNQLEAGDPLGALPAGSILTAATAAQLTAGINALNVQIVNVAKANGAVVYDLNAFLHKVKGSGASAAGATITANFLGGFYTLDAVYPGPTGNSLIANDFLSFLNSTYHKSFPMIDVGTVLPNDPVISYVRPKGRLRTLESIRGGRR
jgi:hypothetical protein